MMYRLASALFCLFLLSSCSTIVKLQLRNDEPVEMNCQIVQQNEYGSGKKVVRQEPIAASSSKSMEFEIENGKFFSISVSPSGLNSIIPVDTVFVPGKPNPMSINKDIRVGIQTLDDSRSLEKIANSFKNLGPDFGAKPIDLYNALETIVGALVVVRPAETGRPAQILYSIPPNLLDVYVMKLEDVRYPATNENEKEVISGKAGISANAAFGPMAAFGLNFQSESVYQLDWTLSGFGSFIKKEDYRDPAEKIQNISDQHVENIKKLLTADPTCKLMYVKYFYILRNASIVVKEAAKKGINASVSSGDIVTATGLYSTENSTETHKSYETSVLNYWGDEVAFITGTFGSPDSAKTSGLGFTGKVLDNIVVSGPISTP